MLLPAKSNDSHLLTAAYSSCAWTANEAVKMMTSSGRIVRMILMGDFMFAFLFGLPTGFL
jgi:hypothetical protein